MRTLPWAALGLSVGILTGGGQAADWPQFRGPGGSATATETNLPEEWSTSKNVAWKVKVPGYGWSSPIVWGDKVFVTTAVSDKQQKPGGFGMPGGGRGGPPGGGRGGPPGGGGGFPGGGGPGGGRGGFGGQKPPDDVYQFEIYCLQASDGKVLWKQTALEAKPRTPKQPSNTYATETPVTDGERVYAYFGMTGVFCYDFSGKQLWKADLGAYPTALGFGSASSPALDGERLFIQCDNEEKSFLVALDTKTGKELWRTPRTDRTSYSTPLVWKNKQRTEVVCIGSSAIRSYDPATGKQLWELGGLSGQSKASPVASAEMLYVGNGGGPGGMGGPRGGRPGGGGPPGGDGPPGGGGPPGFPGGGRGGPMGGGARPLFAVKAGASGDITLKDGAKSNDGVAWSLSQGGPPTASPLLLDGHLYVLEERGGVMVCYDARTGKQIYKERIAGAGGFTSSPWAYEGKIFCLDDAGTTHVIKAGPEFQVIRENPLEEMCWSSVAVAGGKLFVRTVDHVFCIGNR